MRSLLAVFVLVYSCYNVIAQSAAIPLNNFYKIHFLELSENKVSENLFPANETQLNLHQLIRDSTIQYSDFSYWFFQRNWITFEKGNAKLYISPLIDFSIGKDITQSSKYKQTLFRNTRGIEINGALGQKFSFLFSFAENQGRFLDYQDDYFNQAGEYYIQNNGYTRENAVIPSGNRTKPFKKDAYDYAYSIGMVSFQATKKLRFELGNQPNFVGVGYRSLLLSDHAINAFGLRTSYQFNKKWSYQWILKNNKNLYRKPKTNFVESPYENKLYSALYLTYKPVENFAISIFSAGNALRGDSLVKHHVQWQSITPLPLVNTDLLINNQILNGISGLNLEYAWNDYRIYGQFVMDKINKKYLSAGQLGMYYFNAFTVKNWWIQVEANYVPQDFYTNSNDKLSYTHAQLPLAHPKGNNFSELILRTQYEWKRFYINITGIFYQNLRKSNLNSLSANSLLHQGEIVMTTEEKKYATNYQQVEIGWRYNRKYNGMFYVSYLNRTTTGGKHDNQQAVMVGWKVGLFNQYLDF